MLKFSGTLVTYIREKVFPIRISWSAYKILNCFLQNKLQTGKRVRDFREINIQVFVLYISVWANNMRNVLTFGNTAKYLWTQMNLQHIITWWHFTMKCLMWCLQDVVLHAGNLCNNAIFDNKADLNVVTPTVCMYVCVCVCIYIYEMKCRPTNRMNASICILVGQRQILWEGVWTNQNPHAA
jgi:hypothetical protein